MLKFPKAVIKNNIEHLSTTYFLAEPPHSPNQIPGRLSEVNRDSLTEI
jgi:hypothetical protein